MNIDFPPYRDINIGTQSAPRIHIAKPSVAPLITRPRACVHPIRHRGGRLCSARKMQPGAKRAESYREEMNA